MSEIDSDLKEGKKLKTSRFAIAAFILPVISIFGTFITLFFFININPPKALEYILVPFIYISFFLFIFPSLSLFSFIFAVVILLKTYFKTGKLKDYALIFFGLLLSVAAFLTNSFAFSCRIDEARIQFCEINLKQIYHYANIEYKQTYKKQYPNPQKWCDILVQDPNFNKFILLCTESSNNNQQSPYKCSYALNPNAEPNSAGDIVLLFETKDGWNQFGGPELMSFDNHYRKGCNVLFNDGRVKFISPKKKDKLKWGKKI